MANFLPEFAGNDKTTPDWWNFYVDGVSNIKRSMAVIILEGPNNISLEQALKLNFRAPNNKAEYEALVASLKLTRSRS